MTPLFVRLDGVTEGLLLDELWEKRQALHASRATIGFHRPPESSSTCSNHRIRCFQPIRTKWSRRGARGSDGSQRPAATPATPARRRSSDQAIRSRRNHPGPIPRNGDIQVLIQVEWTHQHHCPPARSPRARHAGRPDGRATGLSGALSLHRVPPLGTPARINLLASGRYQQEARARTSVADQHVRRLLSEGTVASILQRPAPPRSTPSNISAPRLQGHRPSRCRRRVSRPGCRRRAISASIRWRRRSSRLPLRAQAEVGVVADSTDEPGADPATHALRRRLDCRKAGGLAEGGWHRRRCIRCTLSACHIAVPLSAILPRYLTGAGQDSPGRLDACLSSGLPVQRQQPLRFGAPLTRPRSSHPRPVHARPGSRQRSGTKSLSVHGAGSGSSSATAAVKTTW